MRRRRAAAPGSFQARRGGDEFDQRTYDDDVPVYSADDDVADAGDASFRTGAQVRHASFGPGRVIETRGSGKDRKLLIHFSTVGLKTILARYVVDA